MQILILLMMMALVADAEGAARPLVRLQGPAMLATWLVPYLLLIAAAAWVSRSTLRGMTKAPERTARLLNRLDTFVAIHRATLLIVFIAQVMLLGVTAWLRRLTHDVILLPSLIALAAPLLTMILAWFSHYPIDRRLREASLIRQLDRGGAVAPIWSARQYVLAQVRHHVLIVLVPLLLLLTWVQVVDRYITRDADAATFWVLGGVAAVFLVAPFLVTAVWDTAPLPAGELRDRLLAMCREYGVRIRQLLLWRTYGGMINGAVMGLTGRARFILLTDGLIERMNADEIEAVMAHEIAHIKRHHMIGMMLCLGVIGGAATTIVLLLAGAVEAAVGINLEQLGPIGQTLAAAAGWAIMAGIIVAVFGWVSRRYERQADTFAVQHLSRRFPDADQPPGVVGAPAVRVFTDALLRVGSMNHIPEHTDWRHWLSHWRHGSIRWRVEYLRGLIGTPLDECAIDRQVRWINAAAVLGLAALMAADRLTRI